MFFIEEYFTIIGQDGWMVVCSVNTLSLLYDNYGCPISTVNIEHVLFVNPAYLPIPAGTGSGSPCNLQRINRVDLEMHEWMDVVTSVNSLSFAV